MIMIKMYFLFPKLIIQIFFLTNIFLKSMKKQILIFAYLNIFCFIYTFTSNCSY